MSLLAHSPTTDCSTRGATTFWRPPCLANYSTQARSVNRSGWPGSNFRPAAFSPAPLSLNHLADELARIGPAECLVAEDDPAAASRVWTSRIVVTKRADWAFGRDEALTRPDAALWCQASARIRVRGRGRRWCARSGCHHGLPPGNPEIFTVAHRSLVTVSAGPMPGDRSGDAAKSGAHSDSS